MATSLMEKQLESSLEWYLDIDMVGLIWQSVFKWGWILSMPKGEGQVWASF